MTTTSTRAAVTDGFTSHTVDVTVTFDPDAPARVVWPETLTRHAREVLGPAVRAVWEARGALSVRFSRLEFDHPEQLGAALSLAILGATRGTDARSVTALSTYAVTAAVRDNGDLAAPAGGLRAILGSRACAAGRPCLAAAEAAERFTAHPGTPALALRLAADVWEAWEAVRGGTVPPGLPYRASTPNPASLLLTPREVQRAAAVAQAASEGHPLLVRGSAAAVRRIGALYAANLPPRDAAELAARAELLDFGTWTDPADREPLVIDDTPAALLRGNRYTPGLLSRVYGGAVVIPDPLRLTDGAVEAVREAFWYRRVDGGGVRRPARVRLVLGHPGAARAAEILGREVERAVEIDATA